MDTEHTYVDRIIGKFRSMSALARALGHENTSTVQGWKERGVIPARQQPRVLESARALGIDLSPADFFDLPNDTASPGNSEEPEPEASSAGSAPQRGVAA